MTVRKRTRGPILVVAVLAATALTAARQQTAPAHLENARTAPATATVPIDPEITTGQFDNGLRYYIRANRRPEKRAELRLAVNVGSIVEEPDQRGLAHFVEHMAFNGTKNFPRQEIVSFMESIGMQFGPSVNASTSFDETIYMLQVPTDRPGVLDRSLMILEDWAHNVSFEPAEIDKERGVIIEEWRLGRGAGARMLDQQFPVLLQNSRYAERLPIGTKEILETFPHDRLKKFYTDWYRPDLMAVVAVGDFNVAEVEALIRKRFGALPKPASPRPRPTYEVPDHPGTLFAVATDAEAPGSSVSVYSKMTLRDPTSIGAYRQRIIESMFGGMLSARFEEMAQKPDAPFMGASAGRGLFVRSKEASMLTAVVRPGEIGRGLEAVFVEAERVARFGFTQTELDRQKTNMLRSFEQAVTERANRQSGSLADEYLRHYTERESIPGIEYEFELAKRFVPAVTLSDVNSLAREWAPEGNRVVLVSAPAKAGVPVPTDAELAAVMKAAASKELTPYVDGATAGALVDPLPAPGRIVARNTRPAVGITEWTLSNGVKVVLKPTTLRQDEIVFQAFSPGGTSLASDADFVAASTAAQVVRLGGLGTLNNIDLNKALTGKVANVQASFSETSEDLQGGGSIKDIETLFQLIYLTFTQPRADAQIFGVLTSQAKAAMANLTAQPSFAFQEALTGALSQNHPRARPMTAERIAEMDLARSMSFYQERFGDAGDFTFVFTGSFDPAAIQPYVEQYLGSLPSAGRKETWRDSGVRPPIGIVERRVEKGVEPQSQTAIVFTGPFEYNQPNRIAIRAMSLILQTRLRETLREDLGGTYSVSVGANYQKMPRPEYVSSVSFGSSPDRTDALVKTVFDQIATFVADGPTAAELADVRQTLIRDLETNMESNSYLATQIMARLEHGEDVEGFFGLRSLYESLTAAAVQQAAKAYLRPDNFVRVSLFPEKKGS
jgi:zinc protease